MLKRMNVNTNEKKSVIRSEYSRLISAAVINHRFRDLLIKDPSTAILKGFQGEQFDIDADEMNRLCAIRANNLADFASQLAQI